MRVLMTSLILNRTFRIPAMRHHTAPPKKPAVKQKTARMALGKYGKVNAVQVAKTAPAMNWPSPPIFQNEFLKAMDMAKDVHSGMGDTLLMLKYSLNPKQLEGVLRKLLEADLITHMQLYERTSLSDSPITRAFVEAEKAIAELDEH